MCALQGGFASWQAAGLPVKSALDYDTSPLDALTDEAEVFAANVQRAITYLRCGASSIVGATLHAASASLGILQMRAIGQAVLCAPILVACTASVVLQVPLCNAAGPDPIARSCHGAVGYTCPCSASLHSPSCCCLTAGMRVSHGPGALTVCLAAA